jgi:hypothetical protein
VAGLIVVLLLAVGGMYILFANRSAPQPPSGITPVPNGLAATPVPQAGVIQAQAALAPSQTIAAQAPTVAQVGFTPQPGALQDLPPATYYVIKQTALRPCPRLYCTAQSYPAIGLELTINGSINGDAIEGTNAVWYRVVFNDHIAFIYSGAVSQNPPPK